MEKFWQGFKNAFTRRARSAPPKRPHNANLSPIQTLADYLAAPAEALSPPAVRASGPSRRRVNLTRKVPESHGRPPRHTGPPRGTIPRHTQVYPKVNRREPSLKEILPSRSKTRRHSNASIRGAASVARARIHMGRNGGLPAVEGRRNGSTVRLSFGLEHRKKRPHNKA